MCGIFELMLSEVGRTLLLYAKYNISAVQFFGFNEWELQMPLVTELESPHMYATIDESVS